MCFHGRIYFPLRKASPPIPNIGPRYLYLHGAFFFPPGRKPPFFPWNPKPLTPFPSFPPPLFCLCPRRTGSQLPSFCDWALPVEALLFPVFLKGLHFSGLKFLRSSISSERIPSRGQFSRFFLFYIAWPGGGVGLWCKKALYRFFPDDPFFFFFPRR